MEVADRDRRGPRQIVGVPLYLMEEPRWRPSYGITLPKRGPSSVFFARRLIPGLPLDFHGWTTSTEAYAEIRIQDESEDANDAIFDAFL